MTKDTTSRSTTDGSGSSPAPPSDERSRGERPPVDPALIDQLIGHAQDGVELLGPDGLLTEITKQVLEAALDAELSDHLGYERGDRGGRGSGNSRNGGSDKTVHTEVGSVRIEVPRDRAGSFEPLIVPKHQSRLPGFNERIISLYARGVTVRDIQAHLQDLYGVEVSPELISRVTAAVLEELKEWQSRPLDRVYAAIYLDAIVCKVRHEGIVQNKAAYLAVGIDVDGVKDVLGIWIDTTEGAKFWLRICNELATRGVEDVIFVCCDGLTGLPDAITTVWPSAIVQTCVVHLVRNTLRYVSYKDRKLVASMLKEIYRAPNQDAARESLRVLDVTWGERYPAITKVWESAWEQFTPFLVYPPDIRRVLYTTNMIESLNYQLRKITRHRGHFPNDDALLKLLYLGVRDVIGKSRRGRSRDPEAGKITKGWKEALNQFEVFFPGRLVR